MSKKAFIIILGISVITAYGSSLIDALINNTLLAGESGFPFKYSRSTLFGKGTIDSSMLILDIVFWFGIIWLIWKILQKILKK